MPESDDASTPRIASAPSRATSLDSAPLLLAVASSVAAFGLVQAFLSVSQPEGPDPRARSLLADRRTPERAAESYFEACRTGDPERAVKLSVGEARHAARLAQDKHAQPANSCSALAGRHDSLRLRESWEQSSNRLELRGSAEPSDGSTRARTELHFVLARHSDGWYVERMSIPPPAAAP